MTKPAAFFNWPSTLLVPWGPYRGVVDRVIDGDTFVAQIDAGMEVYPIKSIRLYGVSAPERHHTGGKEATVFLEDLLPRDEPVLIHSRAWSFGRIVGSVILKDGRDVAQLLVEAGHATPA